jgi:dolichol-phosphate mannosyltransferase
MKTLIVVPTYNERDNITPFMDQFLTHVSGADLLVVDDSSPDKTYEVVKERALVEPRVHLLLRTQKQGLGKAYAAGFQWGFDQGYEVIVQMDADFSHRFEDLNKLLHQIPAHDLCVGSRWVSGGGTVNWGLLRKIISRGGSFYSRLILGFPLRDWTGGFNAWKAKTLQAIDLPSLVAEGYGFQIEMKYRALKSGFDVKEVPILFEERRVGQSKMSSGIVLEALKSVWKFRLWKA